MPIMYRLLSGHGSAQLFQYVLLVSMLGLVGMTSTDACECQSLPISHIFVQFWQQLPPKWCQKRVKAKQNSFAAKLTGLTGLDDLPVRH